MNETMMKKTQFHSSSDNIIHRVPIDKTIEQPDPSAIISKKDVHCRRKSQNNKSFGSIEACEPLPPLSSICKVGEADQFNSVHESQNKTALGKDLDCGEIPPPPTKFTELENMECEMDENLFPSPTDFSEIEDTDCIQDPPRPQTVDFSEIRGQGVEDNNNIATPVPDNFAEVGTPDLTVPLPLTTEFEELRHTEGGIDLSAWLPEPDQAAPGAYHVAGVDDEEKSANERRNSRNEAQIRNVTVMPIAYPCSPSFQDWPRAIPVCPFNYNNTEEIEQRPNHTNSKKLSPLLKAMICVLLCSCIVTILIIKTSVKKSTIWKWERMGSLIRGTHAFDRIGSSISMCSNGQRVAIGGTGYYKATALIYDFVNGSWVVNVNLTDRIPTSKYRNMKRTEVSLSHDCKRIAIGVPYFDAEPVNVTYGVNGNRDRGNVLVYHLEDNNWNELGKINLDMYGFSEQAGHSIAFSGDGRRIGFGGITLSVFQLKSKSNEIPEWERIFYKKGITGASFYHAIDMDYHGTKIAIGQPQSSSGNVLIYDIASSKLVAAFSGTSDYRIGESISLSSNGNRLAIGMRAEKNIEKKSCVRVYEYSEGFNQWSQLGRDIEGESFEISLADEGHHLATGSTAGHVNSNSTIQIYEINKNVWRQIGNIMFENDVNQAGFSISISSNGTYVAFGTPDAFAKIDGVIGKVFVYGALHNHQAV